MTTYIKLDDESANVELVYIQTKEMKDHFIKYPEIIFMDTAYNVNKEGNPLFAILAEDGMGGVSQLRIAMLDLKPKRISTRFWKSFVNIMM